MFYFSLPYSSLITRNYQEFTEVKKQNCMNIKNGAGEGCLFSKGVEIVFVDEVVVSLTTLSFSEKLLNRSVTLDWNTP